MGKNLQLLNLPEFDFTIKNIGQSKQIFDLVRRRFVTLTPEEWVRQHFLRYMIDFRNFPASLLSVEKLVKVNKLSQRADIVAYNKNGKPWLIVECKAPTVKIDHDTFFQAARYSSVLNVPYFALTNGLSHFFLFFNGERFEILNDLPDFKLCF